MKVYYFTRTGRSKAVAEEIADRHGVTAKPIDDHKNWDGPIQYLKAGLMSMNGKEIPVTYEKPEVDDEIIVVFPLWAGNMPPGVKTFVEEVGKERITAVVTSLGSTLKKRDGFKEIVDLVGKEELKVPENL